MLLRVLGSGTCELRREKSSPAYLVEAGGASIMLDIGRGALQRLMQAGRNPANLTGLLLSHHHPDHIGDLIPLLFALNYDQAMKQKASLTLVGHQALEKMFRGLEGVFSHWLEPDPQNCALALLEPGRSIRLGGVKVQTAEARHMETSLAYRLEAGGASLVYLGDSQAADHLAGFARGADLLLAHCAGSDQAPKPGHLSPRKAGRLAAQARVKGLLLSHLYSDVDPQEALASARRAYGGKLWAAQDHMELTLPLPD